LRFSRVARCDRAVQGTRGAGRLADRALDRLEADLGEEDYLVGSRFTVADLTAATLLYPLVSPPQAPSAFTHMPEPYERFRASLRKRRGYRWVQEIFHRHRLTTQPGTQDATKHDAARAAPSRR
jgi:glutathione S-transferase